MQLVGVVARDEGAAALVVRARNGDRDAFARLMASRADRALRTARAILGNEADAHDAAQNALVSAWVNLPRLRDVDRFDAWIGKILRNECREALRRRNWSHVTDLSSVDVGTASRARDLAATSVDSAAVKSAFGRLGVDDRTILLLHHLHDLPLAEVARHLGIPVGTAKSRLFGARRALERALEAER
jgi:RNA polymerase sigma-70 factor (ECF subfamily)